MFSLTNLESTYNVLAPLFVVSMEIVAWILAHQYFKWVPSSSTQVIYGSWDTGLQYLSPIFKLSVVVGFPLLNVHVAA